jgi:hypothetical protein
MPSCFVSDGSDMLLTEATRRLTTTAAAVQRDDNGVVGARDRGRCRRRRRCCRKRTCLCGLGIHVKLICSIPFILEFITGETLSRAVISNAITRL